MLTAFCFSLERGNNLRSHLSPLAIWEKSQYFKRAGALIKYFKQRKTDIAAQSLLLCPPLQFFFSISLLQPLSEHLSVSPYTLSFTLRQSVDGRKGRSQTRSMTSWHFWRPHIDKLCCRFRKYSSYGWDLKKPPKHYFLICTQKPAIVFTRHVFACLWNNRMVRKLLHSSWWQKHLRHNLVDTPVSISYGPAQNF